MRLTGARRCRAWSAAVQLEWQVPPFVITEPCPVEPDLRVVIHRAEVNEMARVGSGGRRFEGEPKSVPGHTGIVPQVVELRLPGAGNPDLPRLRRVQPILGQ